MQAAANNFVNMVFIFIMDRILLINTTVNTSNRFNKHLVTILYEYLCQETYYHLLQIVAKLLPALLIYYSHISLIEQVNVPFYCFCISSHLMCRRWCLYSA